MRKKLLALLMCATMVLGSSAVAFAAPSDDDWTNAGKIVSNSENIINELYKENTTVKTTAYVTTLKSTATFGYNEKNNLAAVKLNDAGKALIYAEGDDYVEMTGKDAVIVEGADGNFYLNPSAALEDGAYATDTVPEKAIIKYTIAGKGTQYAIAEPVDPNGNYTGSDVKATRYSITQVMTLDSDGNYKSTDGWTYTVDSNASLFTADTKDVTGSGLTAIKYTSAKNIKTYKATFAKALENGVLTKNAVAVVLTAYASVGSVNETPGSAKWLKLNEVSTPVEGFSVTSLTDLLSRTSLSDSINIFNINDQIYTIDSEIGDTIFTLGQVASDIDITGSKFTFTLPLSGANNVIIFDQAEAESNNDGVASETTTTTASQTAASSPKTGDVAPIAALAVVMMGACGAMVVASKKRA
jgi:hypothetical protein